MISPAHDISIYLATILGGAFFTGSEPDAPDDVVTVYDTGGLNPDTDELDIERPTFQVRVRDRNYALAYARHRSIRDQLIYDEFETDHARYALIVAETEILSLGRDDNNRFILVANYRAMRSANAIAS